jgi:hypothetical protein
MTLSQTLRELAGKATQGPWWVCIYDAGDKPHYDHNGPCPSIQAPDSEDCAVVHWDGFKQKYWSACNGKQEQIEANAALIVMLQNNIPAILAALKLQERVDAPETVEVVARAMAESDNCYYFAQTDKPRPEHERLAQAAIAAMKGSGQ